MKYKVYVHVFPDGKRADDINIPTFRECVKVRVDDIYDEEVGVRRYKRYTNPSSKYRKVLCIETGEVFDSVLDAALMCGNGKPNAIYQAILRGYSSGTCRIVDEEEGRFFDVPAHWKYVE